MEKQSLDPQLQAELDRAHAECIKYTPRHDESLLECVTTCVRISQAAKRNVRFTYAAAQTVIDPSMSEADVIRDYIADRDLQHGRQASDTIWRQRKALKTIGVVAAKESSVPISAMLSWVLRWTAWGDGDDSHGEPPDHPAYYEGTGAPPLETGIFKYDEDDLGNVVANQHMKAKTEEIERAIVYRGDEINARLEELSRDAQKKPVPYPTSGLCVARNCMEAGEYVFWEEESRSGKRRPVFMCKDHASRYYSADDCPPMTLDYWLNAHRPEVQFNLEANHPRGPQHDWSAFRKPPFANAATAKHVDEMEDQLNKPLKMDAKKVPLNVHPDSLGPLVTPGPHWPTPTYIEPLTEEQAGIVDRAMGVDTSGDLLDAEFEVRVNDESFGAVEVRMPVDAEFELDRPTQERADINEWLDQAEPISKEKFDKPTPVERRAYPCITPNCPNKTMNQIMVDYGGDKMPAFMCVACVDGRGKGAHS